jgi:hypothetical protein
MNTLQRGILWVILISVFVPAEGANWTQNGGITEKAYTAKHLIAPGVINPSPSYDYCKGGEGFGVTGDIALVFDISSIIQMTGDTFDVNNIHVDAFVDGKYTLNKWLDNWQSKGNHTRALGLLYGNNLLGKSSITVCVGSLVQLVTTDAGLQSIFLWYDGPIAVPSHVSTSPPMYTNINGNIGGSIPESKAPHPITGGKHPGDLPDLIVNDFYPVKNEGDRTATKPTSAPFR